MSEEKLKWILEEVAIGCMDIEDAFEEIACEITFQETYEGEF